MRKLVLIVLVVCVLLVSGCNNPIAGCTKEAKLCPGGTSVGRNPWRGCQFDPCPEACQKDADCVVAVDVSVCCSCPSVYLRTEVEENDDLMIYEQGKDYSEFIKGSCEGIMCKTCLGPEEFIISCEDFQCRMIQKRDECSTDNDCVPLPSDCHPTECINKVYESQYTRPEMCTEMFSCSAAYSAEDCLCQNNLCVNKNLGNKGCE